MILSVVAVSTLSSICGSELKQFVPIIGYDPIGWSVDIEEQTTKRSHVLRMHGTRLHRSSSRSTIHQLSVDPKNDKISVGNMTNEGLATLSSDHHKLTQPSNDWFIKATSHDTTDDVGLARNPADPRPPPPTDPVELDEKKQFDHLIVVPEYKLLFCYVEKVGCSMFNQLFRMLRLYHPSLDDDERAYLARGRLRRLAPAHFGMGKEHIGEILKHKEWTKAVFFRDPAERFLSAFKSKCGMADGDGYVHCRQAFGRARGSVGKSLLNGNITSFHKAVDIAYNNSAKVFKNRHFDLTQNFCGGLDATIDYYQFVHKLDRFTVDSHIETLFHYLGVESNLTHGLIERVVRTGGTLQRQDLDYFRKNHGLRVKASVPVSHNTAGDKVTSKDFFGSAERLEKLQQVYQKDYNFFQLKPTKFEDL